MAKGKRKMPKAVTGGPKEKHRRKQQERLDPKTQPRPDNVGAARATVPAVKSKHHSYFEFVENKGHKKKKLEFQITTDTTPPPGFEFVPITSTNLTTACKELSREAGAMIFIVSESNAEIHHHLSHQLHRNGHHIRETIVQEAIERIADMPDAAPREGPEPIPKSQVEYEKQVNTAIQFLFPNIPNTDRESIIAHGFRLTDSAPKVGLNETMPLHKRVQHAVLAHIRHRHTRYDALLREVGWAEARKIVEPVCLDILVKWRGDEENGRDQLDEILREVVVISDSDSDDSEEDEDSDDSDESMTDDGLPTRTAPALQAQFQAPAQVHEGYHVTNSHTNGFERQAPHVPPQDYSEPRYAARKKQSGFKRYRQAWDDAVQRSRGVNVQHVSHSGEAVSHGPQHAYGGAPPTVSMGIGSIPEPNGFVAPRPNGPAHSSARPVSPAAGGLQDMLVRSIEPASPGDVKPPAFVRSLPPRAQLSPVRRSIQNPLTGHNANVGDRPFYVGNNRVTESIAERMHEPHPGHSGSPFPAERHVHPSMPPVNPHGRPAAHGASVPAHRVAVGVGRPGDSYYNPVIMEDRGGFYERVHEPLAPTQPPASHISSGQWRSGGVHIADRVGSWEEAARYMREAQNNDDIEIYPVPEPRARPSPPDTPRQPPHPQAPRYYDDQQPQGFEYPRPSRAPQIPAEAAYPSRPVVYDPDAPYLQHGQLRHNDQQWAVYPRG